MVLQSGQIMQDYVPEKVEYYKILLMQLGTTSIKTKQKFNTTIWPYEQKLT